MLEKRIRRDGKEWLIRRVPRDGAEDSDLHLRNMLAAPDFTESASRVEANSELINESALLRDYETFLAEAKAAFPTKSCKRR